jgi:hypothetical protein
MRGLRPVLCCLLVCAPLVFAQRPSDADSKALIERSRQKALAYTQSLPDFECSEVVHRDVAPSDGKNTLGWRRMDVLTIKLGYFEHREQHKLELINGAPSDKKYEQLAGAIGRGEFGGVLRTIFDPASQTAFDWDSWKSVKKRRVAVYQYAVSAANSPYSLGHNGGQAIVGLHGVVEIDNETGEVLHFTYVAYDIPTALDLQSAISSVDYDLADVGGRNYLLPVRSETELHSSEMWTRNKMEFRGYHKFSAESVIDFGTGK